MRKFLLITLMLFVPCFAAEINAVSQPVTMPQNIMFADCTKIFTVNKEAQIPVNAVKIGTKS